MMVRSFQKVSLALHSIYVNVRALQLRMLGTEIHLHCICDMMYYN